MFSPSKPSCTKNMIRVTLSITPPPTPTPPPQVRPARAQKFSNTCISGSFCRPSIKPLLATQHTRSVLPRSRQKTSIFSRNRSTWEGTPSTYSGRQNTAASASARASSTPRWSPGVRSFTLTFCPRTNSRCSHRK